MPSLLSNSNLSYSSPSLYSAKSKYFSKTAFCLNQNTNLNFFALNKKAKPNKSANFFKSGSGILLIYQQLFEQGRMTNFDVNMNLIPNTNYESKQNFILLVAKKSNLILGIKMLSLIPTQELKISKISFTQNFNFFMNPNSKGASAANFNMDPISFSTADKTLLNSNSNSNSNNEYYFELKILDLNILGKNFLYKVEYSIGNNTQNSNGAAAINNVFESSCVLFERMNIDENFFKFSTLFDNESLNALPMKAATSNNLWMIVGVIVGFSVAIGVIVLFLLRRRMRRMGNLSVQSIKVQKSVYNNLDFGVNNNNINIISRDSISNKLNNNQDMG